MDKETEKVFKKLQKEVEKLKKSNKSLNGRITAMNQKETVKKFTPEQISEIRNIITKTLP